MIHAEDHANYETQYQPFMQIVSKILSRNQEFFRFSDKMLNVLDSYLDKSTFYDCLMKKSVGLMTIKDQFGNKISTITHEIMEKILDKKFNMAKELEEELNIDKAVEDYFIEDYLINDRDKFGKNWTCLKTDFGVEKNVISNIFVEEFEKLFNMKTGSEMISQFYKVIYKPSDHTKFVYGMTQPKDIDQIGKHLGKNVSELTSKSRNLINEISI